MSSLLQLEKEAQARRAQFAKTLLEVRGRLTLSGLANETLGLINLQFTPLRSAYSAIKRNPILAAGVLAGVGWLFKQALAVNGRSLHGRTWVRPLSPKPRKKRLATKSNSLPPSLTKKNSQSAKV
jgi:hypothetical protein